MIRRRTGTQRQGAEECVDDYEMMGGVSNRSAPPSTGFESRPPAIGNRSGALALDLGRLGDSVLHGAAPVFCRGADADQNPVALERRL